MSRQETLRQALDYAIYGGFRVIPLWIPLKTGGCSCPAGKKCSSIGKHPMIPKWRENASSDPTTIVRWSREARAGMNIGILGGPIHSDLEIVILDVDPKNGGDASLTHLREQVGELPPTLQVLTGGGGRHFYYLVNKGLSQVIKNKAGIDGFPGLDLRSDGGYVVAPPSIHASGERYVWFYGDSKMIRLLSKELIEAFTPVKKERPVYAPTLQPITHPDGELHPYVLKALSSAIENVSQAAEGTRRNTLRDETYGLAGFIPDGLLEELEVRSNMEAAGYACQMEQKEIDKTIEDSVADGKLKPRSIPKSTKQRLPPIPKAPPVNGTPTTQPGGDSTLSMVPRFSSMGAMRKNPPSPPIFVIGDGFLQTGTMAMLNGPPKTFKTWLGMHMALCIVGGRPVFDHFPVETQGPVLLISYEGGMSLTYQRLDQMARSMGIDEELNDLEVWDPLSLRFDYSNHATIGLLVEFIKQRKPVALIIDPFVECHTADENATDEMTRITRLIREVALRHDVATVVIHHDNKEGSNGGRPSPRNSRGSSALYGAVTSAYSVGEAEVAGGKGLQIVYNFRAARSPDDMYLQLDPVTLTIKCRSAPPKVLPKMPIDPRIRVDACLQTITEYLEAYGSCKWHELEKVIDHGRAVVREARVDGVERGLLVKYKGDPSELGGPAPQMVRLPFEGEG